MTNILIIIDNLRIGGAQDFVLNICKNINLEEHNIKICCLRGKGHYSSFFEKLGVETIYLNKNKFNLLSVWDLMKIIRTYKISVIHTFLFSSNILGSIAGIFTIKKIIVHNQSGTNRDVYNVYFRWKVFTRAYFLIHHFLLKHVNKLIVITKKDLNYYLENKIVPKNNIVFIPNSVDLNIFNPNSKENIMKKELRLGQKEKIVGIVCRLSAEKGIEYLISAANDILDIRQDVTFIIVGGGPIKDKLHKIVHNTNKSQKIIFTGYRTDIPKILPCFDVFVMPSLSEPFGIVILEAMASGVPVIATNSGGPAEIIENGVDGLLVEPRDSKQLSEKILFLLDHPGLGGTFIDNALKKITDKYDIRIIVKQLEKVYESICPSKS